ncbi:MAG: hypothetical protein H7Y31_18320 [Chitinophagaceae bacterium]|nr:hypothetical protein [Chitinophagaceae bacterium]
MKNFLLSTVGLVCLFQFAISQGAGPGAAISPKGPPALPIFIEDINGRPFSSKAIDDIEGSAFLLPDWNWGAVKFRDGRFAKDIQLRFNIYNNQLYFRKGEQQLEFVSPVHEFLIGYMQEFDSVAVIYRSGYPQIDNQTFSTFYELQVEGNFQLIKHRSKYVRSFKPYNQPEKKQFADNDGLYAYLPGGKMVKLKKDKDAILQAMPEYATTIQRILDQKKIKLKTDDGLIKLFTALNLEPSR